MTEQNLGLWGEEMAARYLMQKGYRILEHRYRTRQGEIDLIAQTGGFLVFVEVKLRKDERFMRAAEAVTVRKQVRLKQTAEMYLQERGSGLQPRFDILELYAPLGEKTKCLSVTHWENAF